MGADGHIIILDADKLKQLEPDVYNHLREKHCLIYKRAIFNRKILTLYFGDYPGYDYRECVDELECLLKDGWDDEKEVCINAFDYRDPRWFIDEWEVWT